MNLVVPGRVLAAAGFWLVLTSPARATHHQVIVRDNFYDPAVLVIEPGDTVVWRQAGDSPHTVTSQPGGVPDQANSFDSNPECDPKKAWTWPLHCMGRDAIYKRTFKVTGRHDYYCKLHAQADERPDPLRGNLKQPCGMCGVVKVRPSSTVTKSTNLATSSLAVFVLPLILLGLVASFLRRRGRRRGLSIR